MENNLNSGLVPMRQTARFFTHAEVADFEDIELRRKNEEIKQYLQSGVHTGFRHQLYCRLKETIGSFVQAPDGGGVLFIENQIPPNTDGLFNSQLPPIASPSYSQTFFSGQVNPQSNLSNVASPQTRMSFPFTLPVSTRTCPPRETEPQKEQSGGRNSISEAVKMSQNLKQQSTSPCVPDLSSKGKDPQGSQTGELLTRLKQRNQAPSFSSAKSSPRPPPLKDSAGQIKRHSPKSRPPSSQTASSSNDYSVDSSNYVSLPDEDIKSKVNVLQQRKSRRKEHTPCKIEMHSSKTGKWYGLPAVRDSGTKENWLNRRIVDRLSLITKRGLAFKCMTFNSSEFESGSTVTSTWCTEGRINSYMTDFRVIDNAPFDVLFGSNILDSEDIQWTKDEEESDPALILIQKPIKSAEKESISATEEQMKKLKASLASKSKSIPRDSKSQGSSKPGGSKSKVPTKD